MSNTTSNKDEKKEKKKKGRRKEKRKCYLELDDGDFEITEEYIRECRSLRVLYLYDLYGPIPVPIQGKSSTIIKKALQFCKDRGEIRNSRDNYADSDDQKLLLKAELKDFDQSFLQQNLNDAFDLAEIAYRLRIKNLYYLMRESAVKMIDHKTADEIHNMFKIHYEKGKTSDVHYEEMRRMMSAACWAFKPIN